jgi:hypothetical protein
MILVKKNTIHSFLYGSALYILLCFFTCNKGCAQQLTELQVYVIQGLSFGTFSAGSQGGTVAISPDGNRTVSGTIIPLAGSTGSCAILEIEAPPNRLIHIEFPKSVQFKGSKKGKGITISNFKSDKPNNSFITTVNNPPYRNIVRVGATLTVQNPAENISDDYVGEFHFMVNYIQQ